MSYKPHAFARFRPTGWVLPSELVGERIDVSVDDLKRVLAAILPPRDLGTAARYPGRAAFYNLPSFSR